MHMLETIGDQADAAHCGLVGQKLSEGGYTASCVVFVTFQHGGCAYGAIGTKKSFTKALPTLPPPPPPPPRTTTVTPEPNKCTCTSGTCPGSKVCPPE